MTTFSKVIASALFATAAVGAFAQATGAVNPAASTTPVAAAPAQDTTNNSISAGSGTAVGALSTFNHTEGGGNINSGNTTSTTTNGGVGQAQTVYQTGTKQIILSNQPAMVAPLTTSGMDTCLGSVTGGVSVPGLGVSGGKTVIDENCVMLKNSKRLQELGLNDAALMLMVLSNPMIADALITTNPEIFQAITAKADKSAEVRKAKAKAEAEKEEAKKSKGFMSELFN